MGENRPGPGFPFCGWLLPVDWTVNWLVCGYNNSPLRANCGYNFQAMIIIIIGTGGVVVVGASSTAATASPGRWNIGDVILDLYQPLKQSRCQRVFPRGDREPSTQWQMLGPRPTQNPEPEPSSRCVTGFIIIVTVITITLIPARAGHLCVAVAMAMAVTVV